MSSTSSIVSSMHLTLHIYSLFLFILLFMPTLFMPLTSVLMHMVLFWISGRSLTWTSLHCWPFFLPHFLAYRPTPGSNGPAPTPATVLPVRRSLAVLLIRAPAVQSQSSACSLDTSTDTSLPPTESLTTPMTDSSTSVISYCTIEDIRSGKLKVRFFPPQF